MLSDLNCDALLSLMLGLIQPGRLTPSTAR